MYQDNKNHVVLSCGNLLTQSKEKKTPAITLEK